MSNKDTPQIYGETRVYVTLISSTSKPTKGSAIPLSLCLGFCTSCKLRFHHAYLLLLLEILLATFHCLRSTPHIHSVNQWRLRPCLAVASPKFSRYVVGGSKLFVPQLTFSLNSATLHRRQYFSHTRRGSQAIA